MNRKHILPAIIIIIFTGLGIAFYHDLLNADENEGDKLNLVVYCAAGVRAPVELLAQEFAEHNEVKVDLVYGNSGNLRSQIKTRGVGDLYIPGDPRFLNSVDYLAAEEIANHFPVLVVNASQADRIETVRELVNSDISFVLVKADSTALGETTEKIIAGVGLHDQLKGRLYGRVATANQVPLYVSLGDRLAGICWYSNYLMYEEDLITIKIPEHLQTRIPIIGVVLSNSEHQKKAEKFLDHLKSDNANEVFEHQGFEIAE
ncbi:MAG: molybdate ABC transporter substrate-binding protein [Bacillota bacterium]